MPSLRSSGRCLLSLLLAAAAGSGFLARPAEADQRPFGGIIDAAARRHGVDPDLVHAVIAVESGYRATAQSPAGAQGLMQLMPGTQRDFGVVDAFDPRQNVDAGVAYLRRLTDEFGTVVALAAYNAGPGAARRYNGIPPYEETRAYLQAVLARNRPAGGEQAAEDHDDTADRLHAGSEADPAEDASADLRLQAADVTDDTIGSLDAEDASADLRLQAGHPTADGEAGLDPPALDEASNRDGPPRVAAPTGYLLHPPGSQTGALSCDISEYTRDNGPRAALEGSTLLVTWRGDADADLRLRLGLDDAQPIVREPVARPHGSEWGTLGRNVRPDFHVTSGKRRVSYQQLDPLSDLGVEITREVMERENWYVFWDAPATGVEGRGYDQGVVEAEAVRTGEGHGVQVSLDVNRSPTPRRTRDGSTG